MYDPMSSAAVQSAAVHAAAQRSLARQSDAFVSRSAQRQAQQGAYYAATRPSRANSRDRSFTDSTSHQSADKEQAMAALLRPRVTRVVHAPDLASQPSQHYHHHHQHYQQQQQHHHHHHHHYAPRHAQAASPAHQAQYYHQQRSSLTSPPQHQQHYAPRHPRVVSPAQQQHYQHQNHHTQQHSQHNQQRHSLTRATSPAQQQRPRQAMTPPSPPKEEPPVEWRVAVDPKTKRPYYYHPVTRQTTWKKPQELVDKEKKERAQFFSAMESNIRAKLREGNWFRDSLTSRPDDLDAMAEEEDDGDLSSSTSTSSRSSWSSATTASVASGPALKPSRHHHQQQTQSLPTSPEVESKSRSVVASSNQDDNDLLLAAAKPPVLFRTLSSYETPVVGETKKLVNGRVIAVPSPIQERVLLAGRDEHLPRSSDLEAYTRPDVSSLLSPESSAKSPPDNQNGEGASSVSRGIARQPLRRRSNSTSTIFVRMGTMNAPDQDTTIQCVATVLRAHLMEAQAAPLQVAPRFNNFINRRDQQANVIPSLKEIGVFIKHVFSRAQMESECIIMSLIYVERLLKATMGSLQLLPGNWRSILFCSMVMASKVWDDLSMCNADFSKIWPELSLKEINDLELAYLSAVEYNVRVSAVSYAKYYFHLRSMCASMGMLKAFDESAPLNLDGARKMQVLSEEYQERSKLLPAPSRRRSVTITTPSSAGADGRSAAFADGGVGLNGASKWSPSASLEQLVQMQSRVAGGTSLATMHRLSTSSASSKA